MTTGRHTGALILSLAVMLNCAPLGFACGPETIGPVFVFKDSPDPPFEDFVRGKLGILLPTMGRKTLFIANRYVNGGTFTGEEQQALIDALHGKGPEDEGEDAIKEWITARKKARPDEEALPAIYSERQDGDYDFFPNCTRSGFETATETLKERTATYGPDDPHVIAWLTAQDIVFQNCAGGSSIPQELGPDNPQWIRKDRDYQIAAALFYSLNLDKARERFEIIAVDNDSPWRQTADYLVGRTLVRQASLTNEETAKRKLYEQAERHLELVSGTGGKFLNASQKLLALISYRLRPEERVGELGRILFYSNGNVNLRQDLIDYVWLLDKFIAQVVNAERKRKEALTDDKVEEGLRQDSEPLISFRAVDKGHLIGIYFSPRKPNGDPDYANYVNLFFKPDASEEEILQTIVEKLGRKLSPDEIADAKELHRVALERRQWLLAPNRKLDEVVERSYEGGYYYDSEMDEPRLNLFPTFLRTDELSDWILTFQSRDPKAYKHALTRWRETDSTVWLLTALSKAQRSSHQVEKLMRQAEKVERDSAAYASIAYHLIRLKIAFGKRVEARKLLEDILSTQADLLPVSAQNQFLELGMQLAGHLSEFLRFGLRRPAAFYYRGTYGKISDLVKIDRKFWDPDNNKQTKEEFEQTIDEDYKDLLPFDNRFIFDEKVIDVLNTHFPLADLAAVGHDPGLPDYLQVRILLAVWTRAILFKNEKIARKVAAEILVLEPQMQSTFMPYLDAHAFEESEHAALWILLRSPDLSPFVKGGVSVFGSAEELDYYFETSWWCTPSDTEYDNYGNEVKKIVVKPSFLSLEKLETARREHAALVAIGNAKVYLGDLAIAWAKKSGDDIRVPEALFIAAQANKSYKYGCDGWESDEGLIQAAESILRSRYPDSLWTARLSKNEK